MFINNQAHNEGIIICASALGAKSVFALTASIQSGTVMPLRSAPSPIVAVHLGPRQKQRDHVNAAWSCPATPEAPSAAREKALDLLELGEDHKLPTKPAATARAATCRVMIS